jgi:hypothetical protein
MRRVINIEVAQTIREAANQVPPVHAQEIREGDPHAFKSGSNQLEEDASNGDGADAGKASAVTRIPL